MTNHQARNYRFPDGAYYRIPFGVGRRDRFLYYVAPPRGALLHNGLERTEPFMGRFCRRLVAAHLWQHRREIKISLLYGTNS